MSRGWAKASECRLQMTLSCAVLCHIVSLQYLSRSSHLSSILVIWSPSGDTRGPSVVFEAVDMPCPGPFHCSHSVHFIYDASLFCACLVNVNVSVPYAIAGSTQELYTCLFRQMARLLFKISRCLAYAAQPAMILRCISLSWFFSLSL